MIRIIIKAAAVATVVVIMDVVNKIIISEIWIRGCGD